MKEISIINKITKIVVDVVFVLGLAAFFVVPFFVDYWGGIFSYDKTTKIELIVILYTSGIVALYLLLQVRKILKSVVNKDVFTLEVVSALRKISVSTFIIAIIYFVKLFLQFGIGTLIIAAAFGIATLIFLTIKDIFKQAVIYKEENDWTI